MALAVRRLLRVGLEFAGRIDRAFEIGARRASASTLRRALQTISVETLEARLSAYVSKAEVKQAQATAPEVVRPGLQGQSIDGKTVRGLRRYGRSLHLVSLVVMAAALFESGCGERQE